MKPRYAQILPTLREVARAHGYALGLHGSTERDLDLIAAPWTLQAAPAADLVRALCAAVDGEIFNYEAADPNDYSKRNPAPKPWGRLAWSIHLDGGAGGYIDLSVMPMLAGVDMAAKTAQTVLELHEARDYFAQLLREPVSLDRAALLQRDRSLEVAKQRVMDAESAYRELLLTLRAHVH